MGSVNKVILIGNLGRDAEMRFTSTGTPVANFSIATTERYTDREGQKKEDTQWHRCVIWGKTAESVHEYLTKGKQVYIDGKLQTREWTDKEGKKVKTTEIRVDRVVLLGGRDDRRAARHTDEADDVGAESRAPAATAEGERADVMGDESSDDPIPF